VSATLRDQDLSPDRLAALEEERDFLLRSIADLEAERAAGDIDEADFQALSDDYTARTAEVLRAIDEHRDAVEAAHPPRSRGRILTVIGGVAIVAIVAGVLVAQASGRREPGQTITGRAPTSATQHARQCIGQQDANTAINCFKAVLDEDPTNATALTYLAWTVYRGSLGLKPADQQVAAQAASGLLDRSVKSDPDFADAYAFRAVIALRTGDIKGASRNLDRMDALDPPVSMKALTDPLRKEIDTALRSSTTTTTTKP
jgi:hypothetical protein